MITVTIFRKNEQIVGAQIEGHAGFARRGKDIVCSAVSILYINLVNSLENLTEDEKEINGSNNFNLSDINFQNVILKNMPSKEAKVLFDSFELGITTIAAKYGKRYIVIMNQEV